MAGHLLFSGRVAKADDVEPEDFLACGDPDAPFPLALADGASESFDSRSWAQLLCNKYVVEPELSCAWVESAVADYAQHYAGRELSWSAEAALARGSFSTLLGVQLGPSAVNVTAIGDSCALLYDELELVSGAPYLSADDFQSRPELLSTNSRHNAFTTREEFPEQISLRARGHCDPLLVCATDALSCWLLEELDTEAAGTKPAGRIALLRRLGTLAPNEAASVFEELVRQEQAAGRMRLDDVTLAMIQLRTT